MASTCGCSSMRCVVVHPDDLESAKESLAVLAQQGQNVAGIEVVIDYDQRRMPPGGAWMILEVHPRHIGRLTVVK